ncbi:MAG: hypothetical protein NC548_11330 [Lachnospiraceae bacterium]|nr:hypothetical protein [Lachnospiraceae bacterium]
MSARIRNVCEMWLLQGGDWEDVNVDDADKYCQCLCNATRCLLIDMIKQHGANPIDTIYLSPVVQQCRHLHIALPSSIVKFSATLDLWEYKHKTEEYVKVRRKTLCTGNKAVHELLELYIERDNHPFVTFDLKGEVNAN